MARNRTRAVQYSAEFRAAPFTRPEWTINRWEYESTEPYAVSTLSRNMLTAETNPARELPAATVTRMWPHGAHGVARLQVTRAFVIPNAPGSRYGVIVALVPES